MSIEIDIFHWTTGHRRNFATKMGETFSTERAGEKLVMADACLADVIYGLSVTYLLEFFQSTLYNLFYSTFFCFIE